MDVFLWERNAVKKVTAYANLTNAFVNQFDSSVARGKPRV